MDNYLSGYVGNCINGITLPASSGPSGDNGAAGSDGTTLLLNSFTNTTSADNLNAKEFIGTTLTAGELSTNGDALEIEGMFTILAGVAGSFSLVFGVNGAPTTTVSTYTVNTPLLTNTVLKLSATISRTAASAQKIEGSYTVVGLADATGTIDITTASEVTGNLLDINLMATKTVSVSAADITSQYLRIKKISI